MSVFEDTTKYKTILMLDYINTSSKTKKEKRTIQIYQIKYILSSNSKILYLSRYLEFCCGSFGSNSSPSMSSIFALHRRHLQHTIHGAANSNKGDATSNKIPKLAKIPITWARCHTTDARECPNLFLHGPLS